VRIAALVKITNHISADLQLKGHLQGLRLPRRFPPPWTVEEHPECFAITDANGQRLAFIYFEPDPSNGTHRAAMNRLTRDEARRIAANFAKVPAFMEADKEGPADKLRDRARECRARAEAASDPTAKAHFDAMAETWERRAREIEKPRRDALPEAGE
jgi:hypothetical protein